MTHLKARPTGQMKKKRRKRKAISNYRSRPRMRFRGSAISPDKTTTKIFPGRSDGSPISGEPPARQQQGSSTQRAPGPTYLDDAEKMPLAWRCDREEREDQPREKEGAPVQLGLRLYPGQMR